MNVTPSAANPHECHIHSRWFVAADTGNEATGLCKTQQHA